jgi:hypothetical protein
MLSEHQHLALGEAALDLLLVHLTLCLVGEQDHDHVGHLHGFGYRGHAHAVLLRACPALGALVQPDHDVLARVLEVEGVGMPLAAVPDDRDLLGLEQAEIGVLVVINLRRHFDAFLSLCWCCPRTR